MIARYRVPEPEPEPEPDAIAEYAVIRMLAIENGYPLANYGVVAVDLKCIFPDGDSNAQLTIAVGHLIQLGCRLARIDINNAMVDFFEEETYIAAMLGWIRRVLLAETVERELPAEDREMWTALGARVAGAGNVAERAHLVDVWLMGVDTKIMINFIVIHV